LDFDVTLVRLLIILDKDGDLAKIAKKAKFLD
jgi:hypothetical protein